MSQAATEGCRGGLRLIYKSDKYVWVPCVREVWSRAGCSVISSLWLHSSCMCVHSLCAGVCGRVCMTALLASYPASVGLSQGLVVRPSSQCLLSMRCTTNAIIHQDYSVSVTTVTPLLHTSSATM